MKVKTDQGVMLGKNLKSSYNTRWQKANVVWFITVYKRNTESQETEMTVCLWYSIWETTSESEVKFYAKKKARVKNWISNKCVTHFPWNLTMKRNLCYINKQPFLKFLALSICS